MRTLPSGIVRRLTLMGLRRGTLAFICLVAGVGPYSTTALGSPVMNAEAATPNQIGLGNPPQGSLAAIRVVISYDMTGQVQCQIDVAPGAPGACSEPPSRWGGSEHYTAAFSAKYAAEVPLISTDDLMTQVQGTGPGDETGATLNASGTYANGSSVGNNCGLESGSETVTFAGSTQAGSQDAGLQAVRDSSNNITDFQLHILDPRPPVTEHITDVDNIQSVEFKDNCSAPTTATSTTTGSSGMAIGAHVINAVLRAVEPGGSQTLSGWTLNPDGNWDPKTGGVVASRVINGTAQPDPPETGSLTINGTIQLVTGTVCKCKPDHISESAKDAIKQHERWKSKQYDNDGGRNCTVGWGHLIHEGRCTGGEPAEFRNGISKARGEEWFSHDLAQKEALAHDSVKGCLDQKQFDALVDFLYNIKAKDFAGSQIRRILNSGDYTRVPSELARWHYTTVDGKKVSLRGLEARRGDEASLFQRGVMPKCPHQ